MSTVNFWRTPLGKILGYGIHEHSSGLGYIINNIIYLKKLIEKKELTDEELLMRLDRILEGKVKCQEAMDYIYTELKKQNSEE